MSNDAEKRKQRSSASNLLQYHQIIDFSILISFFTILCVWSWRKWPDILIDFGRELYIPWQISSGKVLYLDIAHFFGPFSQYINAFFFYIFDPSYTVIIAINIVVLFTCLILIYIILSEVASRFTAMVCCCLMMSIFSFSQYVGIGNYNFLSPYAHENTHGTLLTLIIIYQLWRFGQRRRKRYLIAAGVSFGLVCLTKIEIILSALMVVSFFFCLMKWIRKNESETIKTTSIFLVSSILPIVCFGFYFLSVTDVENALSFVFKPFITLCQNKKIVSNVFYKSLMGLDDPFHNFIKMIRSGIFVLAAIISALFLCHMIKKYKGNSVAVVFFAFIIGVIISLTFNVDLSDIGRPLPLLSLSALIFLVYLLKKSIQEDTITAINHIPVLLLNIFGFFLLFKMFFYSRMFHYGFYLTLPATLTLVCVLTWYLPKWFKTRYLGSEIFLVFVILVFVIFSIKFINVSDYYFRAKTFSVGAGKDRIVTYDPKYDSRTIPFSQAIAWIKANVAETDSLIVFPEGIMINFLTKRINPTPYINFMPPEMMIFGDNRILDAIKMNSPDYFVIVSRDTAEYGYDIFGRDKTLGNEIMNWVKEHYEQVVLFGHDPILKNRFGIKIMKHRN